MSRVPTHLKNKIFSKAKVLVTNLKHRVLNLTLQTRLNTLSNIVWSLTIEKLNFIYTFYARNENMWNDGFLFDFLQKKTADAWVRRFVIYTGFLFSERVIFEFVVRIYLDNLIWPLHTKNLFEAANTAEMLTTTIFLIIAIFFSLVLTLSFTLL